MNEPEKKANARAEQKTKADPKVVEQLRKELLDEIDRVPEKLRETTFFTRAKAALYLKTSVRTLVRRYKAGKPPPMVEAWTNGTKGIPVNYRLSVLIDTYKNVGFQDDEEVIQAREAIQRREEELSLESPPEKKQPKSRAVSPYREATDHLASGFRAWNKHIGFLSDDSFAHRQAWLTTEQADNEAAQFAFFVDERGLILRNAWQSAQQTFDMLMSPKTDVVWQTWISALADVWADESERQRVLMECADIDASVPQLVQDLRDAKLAAI